MKLGTHMPDDERREPIDIEVCRSKVKVTLSMHMFATRLSYLWCVTDFYIFILCIYLQQSELLVTQEKPWKWICVWIVWIM